MSSSQVPDLDEIMQMPVRQRETWVILADAAAASASGVVKPEEGQTAEMESFAPVLEALAAIHKLGSGGGSGSEEAQAIHMFFTQELVDANRVIAKLEGENKAEIAVEIREGTQKKTEIMIGRIKKNKEIMRALKKKKKGGLQQLNFDSHKSTPLLPVKKPEIPLHLQMAFSQTPSLDEIKKMPAYEVGAWQQLCTIAARTNLEKRLEEIEKLAPKLEHIVAENLKEEGKCIDVFFHTELPSANEQIAKFEEEGKRAEAREIRRAMAMKTQLMVQRIEKNAEIKNILEKK